MLALIRLSVCDGKLDDDIKENITEENLAEIYNLAARHDILSLVADALLKNNLLMVN